MNAVHRRARVTRLFPGIIKAFLVFPLSFAILLGPPPARALDLAEEIVITATRLETPVEEVSGSILVITAEDMRRKQVRTVADALKGIPGIDLVNQGGLGKTTSVLMRGGDARFTLVLVDGVEVNDPSNPERTFDFAHMGTEDVERIEILFGPQSTLYGSDAIGGVIQIITRKGTGAPGVEVLAEAGTFDTRRGQASIRGRRGRAYWSLSGSTVRTEGISAAAQADGNTEKDSYENTTLSGHLGFDLGSGGAVRLDLRSVDAGSELDYSGGPGGDDPNFTGDAEQLLFSGRLTLFPAEAWESSLAVSRNTHERHDVNRPDPVRDFSMELDFTGRSDKAEWINNLYLSDHSVFTVGLDTERESGESSFFSDESGSPYTSAFEEKPAAIDGVFVQEQYTAESGFTATLGARADDHSRFGGKTTYRVGFSLPLGERARVRAVYGTGFRAPSVDQLFNPDYGNPDLDAETSRGWDVGLETTLGGGISTSLSWFLTKYEDLVAWFDADGDPDTWWDGSYANISRARTEGVDFAVDARLGAFSLGGTASWLATEDDKGDDLLRRPETRWGARVGFDPSGKASLNLAAAWVGERKDWGAILLDDYMLVNLSASLRITRKLELTGRVENLLDEQYEEAGGYGMPGAAVYVGVKAEL